ncbi:phosphotriesterase family protein [Rhodococcus globerulus]|uniref:Aryldialkylphosphatase n=1 Tax=Rhodococcus globerulus TaxID=33008 RepID=A0ABU4C306_RHOGO|nr:hypothetical protein [Rhodococcus globerulus]MDV6270876.1 hypothetical protein [Rhodococcus globerulus]
MTSASPGSVRTVLGDVESGLLGWTNYHEHLFQVSPLLPGDELDDEQRSGDEAGLAKAGGINAMVDATPIGLGRNPEATARISAKHSLHVVATTGMHREAHYGSDHWLQDRSVEQLTALLVRDVATSMPTVDEADSNTPARGPGGSPVRAGVLKLGIGYWEITDFERRALAAVAAAHVVTNAPITIHLEYCTAAFEVLDLLRAEGVDSDAIGLAHVDRNPDPGLHADLAATGAYLGYDGFARSRNWPDSVLLDCFTRAAELGAEDRLLLGGDVARRSRYVAYGGMPGLAYLTERVVPRLERAGRLDLIESAMVRNPARWLGRFGI